MVELADTSVNSDRNQYFLRPDQLRMPEGSKREQLRWLAQLVNCQQEGMDFGIKPQMPPNLYGSFARTWRSQVWNQWTERIYGRFAEGLDEVYELGN